MLTPETYLGSDRSEAVLPNRVRTGSHAYRGYSGDLPLNHLSLAGTWSIGAQAARAVHASSLDLAFGARRVFLVLSSAGNLPRRVRVRLDGQAIGAAQAGPDVANGALTVRRQRLYRIVDLPRVERHRLELHFDAGVSGYAFTFG